MFSLVFVFSIEHSTWPAWCHSPGGCDAGRCVERLRRSLRLDAREPDHLAPFLRVFGDELAEIRRRASSAVELLGSTDLDQWEEIVKLAKDDPDPYRRFFTIAAVKDLKTLMAVVGKMVPHHIVHSPAK
jgi:hypothetical protein